MLLADRHWNLTITDCRTLKLLKYWELQELYLNQNQVPQYEIESIGW